MGGRAERLGGIAKGDLRVDGTTLLERVVAAAGMARHRVVVGDAGATELPGDVVVVREEPPFSGPAAGVAAGVAALPPRPGVAGEDAAAGDAAADAVLLLAGDLPFVAEAIPPLLAAFVGADAARADGAMIVDETGRAQYLTAVVRRAALDDAIAAAGRLEGASMRRLVAALRLVDVALPGRATMDVDTWADARAVGATAGEADGTGDGSRSATGAAPGPTTEGAST
ncbi:NTP transferase domain-containing protein [Agromyces luteolus]|uniref:NTP transferase domain-containing protein n=2 Tax=Agromyces luteolus TaxID=88373 RepID=A0A7C9HK04_9MICO|nr:NTP transferase domain-containing protein [Agromyces luteolus]MUN06824.1 NTP transferase domain-containing protein [Agromyces luteolus]